MQQISQRLRERFLEVDHTVDALIGRIGEAGQAALGRNSTVAADRALRTEQGAAAYDPQAVLARLWILQQAVPQDAAERALPGLVEPLCGHGILQRSGGEVRALVDVRPYAADDGTSGWVVSDFQTLDGPPGPQRGDHVLGISPASTALAQMTQRDPVVRSLDLGAGCGVQSLHLVRHSAHVVATDLNPRANELAAWTFALSEVEVDQRLGSLWEPVAGERFDLVVTNPPYVMSPPDGERLVYREGSMPGDGLVEAIVRGSVDHLSPGGSLQVLGNWAILDPERWAERLEAWIPAGCDALVLERERLDPYEYVEIWLADAGLVGRPEHAERYRAWLDYFDGLGIEAVGMGWLQVTRADTDRPRVRLERWPHAVSQPVGDAFSADRAAAACSRLTDQELWETRWRLADGIDQETIGDPGASDPRHVVLRSRRGFCRAVEVDTALGGVLGACDGELTLGQLTDAVAGLLDLGPESLKADLLPRLRELVDLQMLVR